MQLRGHAHKPSKGHPKTRTHGRFALTLNHAPQCRIDAGSQWPSGQPNVLSFVEDVLPIDLTQNSSTHATSYQP